MGQQLVFDVEQEVVVMLVEVFQFVVVGNYVMIGDDEWKWIGVVGLVDSVWCIFEVFGQLIVGVGLVGWNGGNFGLDVVLEGGVGWLQWQFEDESWIGQIGV